jgi:TRAP-type uncharacterized transport system substrate-binding protein
MADDLAEKLTKLIYENTDALIQVNAAAKAIVKEDAAKTDPVQLHPGAQKALDSLG